GTYEAIPFSVTEDFQLLMAFHNLKKYKIIYPLDKDALVTSKPCPDVKSLYAQKKRWGVGGMESDFAGYFVMGIGFVNHLFMIISPFFFTPITVSIIMTKVLIDFIFLLAIHTKLKLRMKIIHYMAFEVYYIIYVLCLPFALLFNRRVQWKDRIFE
ncbi:MAG: glycosyl transferase, partial [Ignavibacteriales bacterium]|nr:glycosyl transferase [Ignavibacteriales bacterium]